MACQGFPAENYALYALGNLSEPESEEIRSHLEQGCPVCREEVRRSLELWHSVAWATPLKEPRRALRRQVVSAAQDHRSISVTWIWPIWAGAASLALVLGSFYFFTRPPAVPVSVRTVTVPFAPPVSTQQLEEENQRLKAQLKAQPVAKPSPPVRAPEGGADTQALRGQLEEAQASVAAERAKSAQLESDLATQKTLVITAQRGLDEANRKYLAANPEEMQRQLGALGARSRELEREVAQYKVLLETERRRLEGHLQLVNVLSSPNLSLVRLRGTEAGRAVEGHALLAAGSQVIFYGSQLPALPTGRTYQLWLIRAQNPAIVSAGTFNPNAQSRATVQFNGALTSGVTAIAVTDEPTGGSEKPTGHKLLVGQAGSAA